MKIQNRNFGDQLIRLYFCLRLILLNDNFQKWVQYPHLGTIVKLCEAVPEWGTVGFGY